MTVSDRRPGLAMELARREGPIAALRQGCAVPAPLEEGKGRRSVPAIAQDLSDESVLPERLSHAARLAALGGLLSGLVRAMASGPWRQGATRTWAGGEWASGRVGDPGPGIAPDPRSRIFEPFFTTNPPGAGTGLGASLSDGILRAHGGAIEADSRPDAGACFPFRLPRDPTRVARPSDG
jgi:signal transduction histidine kinase